VEKSGEGRTVDAKPETVILANSIDDVSCPSRCDKCESWDQVSCGRQLPWCHSPSSSGPERTVKPPPASSEHLTHKPLTADRHQAILPIEALPSPNASGRTLMSASSNFTFIFSRTLRCNSFSMGRVAQLLWFPSRPSQQIPKLAHSDQCLHRRERPQFVHIGYPSSVHLHLSRKREYTIKSTPQSYSQVALGEPRRSAH
jgi:hypothetical protein